MFLSHVGPEGQLWKAWVAAHWERRLRRQDYQSADIRGSIEFARQHLQTIPLRCLGHLLVGFCRLLLKKVILFDEKTEEVRLSLQTSREVSLPVVPTLSQAALTLNRTPRGTHWDQAPDADLGVICDLDMVFEPPPLEELLEAGRRHTLPEDSITLHPATPSPPRSSDSPIGDVALGLDAGDAVDQAFGAPTPDDRAAMEALRSASRGPQLTPGLATPGAASGSEPPEIDQLLGASTHGGGHMGLGLHSGSVMSRLGGFSAPGKVTSGGGDLFGIDPSAPSALVPSSLPRSGPPDLPPIETLLPGSPPIRPLRFDLDVPMSGGIGGGHLYETLGFSPPGSTDAGDAAMTPLAPLVDDKVEAADIVEALGLEREPEPLEPVVEELPLEGPPQQQEDGQPPQKRRRRRIKPWFDEITTISKDEYRDTTAITRDLSDGHTIYLPHRRADLRKDGRPWLPFTTTYSDCCELLADPIVRAVEVGDRRRQARVDAAAERETKAAAATAAGPMDLVLEAADMPDAGSPAVPPPPLPAGSPPAAGAVPSPLAPGSAGEAEALAPVEGAVHGGTPLAPVDGSPLPLSPPPTDELRPPHTSPAPLEGGGFIPSPHAPAPLLGLSPPVGSGASPEALADPYCASTPGHAGDVGHSPSPGAAGPPSVPGSVGASVPLQLDANSPLGASPVPATPGAPSAAPTPTTAGWSIAGVVGEDTPAPSPVAPSPAAPSSEAMSPWPSTPDGQAEACSFFTLVKAPPGDADAAAKRFLSLLSLHMEGAVVLEQAQPYGDITIHPGAQWPGGSP